MVYRDNGAVTVSLREAPGYDHDDGGVTRRILRGQLVDAAVGLFVKRGYHETTTPDIAQAAGWSVGELYEFVKSKSDILYLVCEVIHEESENLLRSLPLESCPTREALEKSIDTYMRACDARQGVILLIYQESTCLAPELLEQVIESEERLTASFYALIQRGVREGVFREVCDRDARLMAHNILVLGQMWAFRRWYLRKQFGIDEYIAAQTENVLRALVPH